MSTIKTSVQLFRRRDRLAAELKDVDDAIEEMRAKHAAESRTFGMTTLMFRKKCEEQHPSLCRVA